MDEPLGALDAEFRRIMCDELRDLHDRIGATTVYVTHDQLEAMSMADRILVMNRGVVEQVATPQEIYDRPNSMFVADFIGSPSMNFIRFEGKLQRGDRAVRLQDANIAVPEMQEDGISGPLALGIRPEHVTLSDSGAIRGRVFGAEYLGTTQIVTIDIEHGRIKARLPAAVTVRLGEPVGLAFQSQRLVVFDAKTGRATRSALYEGERRG